MRVLFITATRLGDAVLSTGLLDHLLRHEPGARFTIVCGPVAAGLFERLPHRDRTIELVKRRFDAHWFELWSACAGTVWDLAIDLRGSAVTFFLPARRRRIMRGGRRPGHRLTHLAGILDLPSPPLPTTWTNAADEARAASLLPHGRHWIGLGPTANWSGKAWPPDRFAALLERLRARDPSIRPAVFAGPGPVERAAAQPLLDALPDAIDLCGRLSLPEVAACLRRCSLFVGNDSGLMHLAAAAGAPTLGLFGPSRPSEYAPSGRLARVVTAPGPEGQGTMASITVETVEREAGLLLA